MKHSQIDEYAGRSPFAGIDPRVKLAALVSFLVVAAFSTAHEATTWIGLSSLVLAALSRIPAIHLLRQLIVALPFIAAIVLGAVIMTDLPSAVPVSIRVTGSVLAAIVFVTTTPLLDQARALQFFRVPKIIVSMLIFTYRFIFVFIDELERMKIARTARGFSARRGHILNRRIFSVLTHTIGMLFIRVSERASRVFDSLRGRGFSGNVLIRTPLRIGMADALYASAMTVVVCLAAALQLGVIQCPV